MRPSLAHDRPPTKTRSICTLIHKTAHEYIYCVELSFGTIVQITGHCASHKLIAFSYGYFMI